VIPLGLAAGLILLIVAALPVVGGRRPEVAFLGGERFVWELTAAFAPALFGAFFAWWVSRRGAVSRAAAALAGGIAVTVAVVALFLLPRFDVFKSARHLSGVLAARAAPGEPYGIYPRLDSTFLFYTRRFAVNLDSEERLRAFLARPGRVWLLAQRDDFAKLEELPTLREVSRDPDPEEGYILFMKP
jgi:hypothetical protein